MNLLGLSYEQRVAELEQGLAQSTAGWEAAAADAERLQAEVDDLHLRLDRAEELAAIRLDTIAEREASIRELERRVRGEPS